MLKFVKYSAVALGVLAIAGTSQVQAQSGADFFKGKTLTLTYGFGTGGTYGKYSLMFGEYLSKYIPGNPTVVTQSMPGAGGLKAANFAFNAMPKDGTGLWMPVDTLVISQLLRPNKVKFKADQFTWLGNAIETNAVIVVRRDVGIKKLEDLKSKQVIVASSGKGSQTFLMPAVMNALYGAKFKIVSGYKGSRKMQLSMEQGESQGVSLTWLAWRSGKPDWFKPGGFAQPVVQIGNAKEQDLPNVPLLSDVVTSDADKQIVAFMASMGPVGRGIAVPPGVPADRIAVLRKAFADMVADPAFKKAAESRNLRLNAKSGEEVQKFVSNALKISPDIVKRARTAIMGPSG